MGDNHIPSFLTSGRPVMAQVGAEVYNGHFSFCNVPNVHPKGLWLGSTIILSNHLLHEPYFWILAKEEPVDVILPNMVDLPSWDDQRRKLSTSQLQSLPSLPQSTAWGINSVRHLAQGSHYLLTLASAHIPSLSLLFFNGPYRSLLPTWGV